MSRSRNVITMERLRLVDGVWRLGKWVVESGMRILRCQCMQQVSREICTGIKGLTFEECNLTNAAVPGDAKVIRCLRIEKSFCSHLNPQMKDLPKCPKDCVHADAYTPAVELDGKIIADEVYVRANKLLSHTPGTTGEKVIDKTVAQLEADASALFKKPIKAQLATVMEIR